MEFPGELYVSDHFDADRPESFDASVFEVTESVLGGSSTDFGAPGAIPVADTRSVDAGMASRHVEIIRASWAVLERAVAAAPRQLRGGPRCRRLETILDHVVAAEAAYARRLGVVLPPPVHRDRPAVLALRDRILDIVGQPSDGSVPVPAGWPARYAVRRISWHALDHAWEIQDRS